MPSTILAGGLPRLAQFDFPVKLNETTSTWLEEAAGFEDKQMAADMISVASAHPDPAAVARLSAKPVYNAQLRTTCVATLLQGGHADNALPQIAQATVNCRVLPGESIDEVQKTLVRVVNDDQISVTPTWIAAQSPPSPLSPEILGAIKKVTQEIVAGRSGDSHHEHRCHRWKLSAERRHTHLRHIRPCEEIDDVRRTGRMSVCR